MPSPNLPSHNLFYCSFSCWSDSMYWTKYKAQCHRTLPVSIPSHISEWELKSTQAINRKWMASQGHFPWFSSMYLTWIMQRPSVHISTTARSKHYTPLPMQVKAALWAGCRAGLWFCSRMAQKAVSCFLAFIFPWITPILFAFLQSRMLQMCHLFKHRCVLFIVPNATYTPLAPLM